MEQKKQPETVAELPPALEEPKPAFIFGKKARIIVFLVCVIIIFCAAALALMS